LKPAPFTYVAVDTVEEAVAALAEHGDEAKILAGGQSLVPLMNMRLAVPGVLVDVNGVRELEGIRANGALEVGAITRQIELQRSDEVARHAPLVAAAMPFVSHPGIRSRGTVGGSVAHADPAAELPACLVALGGEVVARGPGGERAIAADDLFVTYFTTALEPTELVTAVRFPKADASMRFGFAEVSRRHGDFALAGAAVAASVDGSGLCTAVRIALFGVGDRPLRATAAEEAVVGRPLADAAADAGRVTAGSIESKSDLHASAQYRREVAGTMVERALAQAGGAA
jgi:carbon-monoxide dehydrogenase medium subunit